MNTTSEFRLKVIKYAKKNTVSEAADLYGVSSRTIFRWIKKYNSSGLSALENKSRLRQNHPRKIPEDLVSRIIALKKRNSSITIKEIISNLNIKYSYSAVSKLLRLSGFSQKQKINSSRKDLKNKGIIKNYEWTISVNFIRTLCIDNKQKLLYQITITELNNGLTFRGFTFEKSSLSVAIFADYLFNNLSALGYEFKNFKFHLPKQSIFKNLRNKQDSTLFSEIIKIKYGINTEIKTKQNIERTAIELLPLYDRDSYYSSKDLLSYSFIHSLTRKDFTFNQSIPPIIVDKFISDIDAIRNNNHYWRSLSLPNVRSKLLRDAIVLIDRKADKESNDYNFHKAVEFYNSAIITLKRFKISDETLELEPRFKKGRLEIELGNLLPALKSLQNAEILVRKIKYNGEYLPRIYNRLGVVYIELGRIDDYERAHLTAEKYYLKQQKQDSLFWSSNLRTFLYLNRKNYHKAVELAQVVYREAVKLNILADNLWIYRWFITCYLNLNKTSEALKYCQEYLNFALKTKNLPEYIHSLDLLIATLIHNKDFKQAESYLEILTEKAKDNNLKAEIAICKYYKAKILYSKRDYKIALIEGNFALNEFQKIGNKKLQKETLKLISKIFLKLGKPKRSLSFKKKSGEISDI